MAAFKVSSIQLRDGTKVVPGQLTVLAGPNNAGKTRALRDLLGFTTTKDHHGLVIEHARTELPSTLLLLKEAVKDALRHEPNGETGIRTLGPTLVESAGNIGLGQPANWEPVAEAHLRAEARGESSDLLAWFGPHFVAFLRAEDRLRLASRATTSMAPSDVPNLLVALYRDLDPATSARLDAYFFRAFGLHLRLDYSTLGHVVLRVGASFEGFPEDQRLAAPQFESRQTLDEQGDGMRSFAGAALGLIVGRRPVVLIDEPEAFLHPPQAVQMGEMIAELANADRQVFVATHSVDVLRGMLNRGGNFDILRLSRTQAGTNSKVVEAADVRNIATDAVLSTARVIEGLFYPGAIVVESDSDSAFYHRVARGVLPGDDVLYTRAHNKQTVHKLLRAYAQLGVPAAAIVDADVIRRADEFSPLLQALTNEPLDVPLALQASIRSAIEGAPLGDRLASLQAAVHKILTDWPIPAASDLPAALSRARRDVERVADEADAWHGVKRLGRVGAPEGARDAFDELLRWCAARHVFIVPIGELEGWLEEHGVPPTRNKSSWIVTALTKLSVLDVDAHRNPWAFVKAVHDRLFERTLVER